MYICLICLDAPVSDILIHKYTLDTAPPVTVQNSILSYLLLKNSTGKLAPNTLLETVPGSNFWPVLLLFSLERFFWMIQVEVRGSYHRTTLNPKQKIGHSFMPLKSPNEKNIFSQQARSLSKRTQNTTGIAPEIPNQSVRNSTRAQKNSTRNSRPEHKKLHQKFPTRPQKITP